MSALLVGVQDALFSLDDYAQRWNEGVHSWRPVSEGGFNARLYSVAPIDNATARMFIETHHYSRSYPADRLRVGLFEGPYLVGVAVLGVPMSRPVLTGPFPTLEPYQESLELSRLVLLDEVPANAESWFVARVFAYAAEQGVRGIIAHSDPMPRWLNGVLLMPGHIGVIYKALNGLYLGRATARTLTVLPDGRVFSARTRAKVTGCESGADSVVRQLIKLGAAPLPAPLAAMTVAERSAWLAQALAAAGARKLRHLGNHRYVWAIGNRSSRRRTLIHGESLPFPTTIDRSF